jgi:acetolactate synthase-1/2/3 large subunit
MIRWKQEADHFPDFGLKFGNPDFVAYAKSYSATGARVTSSAGFLPTLKAALSGEGVHLVVVPIDYSENMRVLVQELPKH